MKTPLEILTRRLRQARTRCRNHPSYADVNFEFTTPEDGARLLLAKLGPIQPGETLDRIDPHGPYSLENLRYAGRDLQAVNRRKVKTGWRARLG